ncbi:hypothetical protein THRCLA_06144 [Thraustotheca clavata]|uniref:NHL repeat containing protein n=1 Tax=Thraustotheca clavata TaxID=74557 RepID=A0A1V9ZQD4_9STRA|nr:hypothetical protein THRCLA_06144 [Thraustotheca clavata]
MAPDERNLASWKRSDDVMGLVVKKQLFHLSSNRSSRMGSANSSKILPTLTAMAKAEKNKAALKYTIPSKKMKGKRASILNRAQSIRLVEEKVSFVSKKRQFFKRFRQVLLFIIGISVAAAVAVYIYYASTSGTITPCCIGAQPFILSVVTGVKAVAMAIDASGAIYIASASTNQIYILSNGLLSTFAGTGDYGDFDGPSAQAEFRYPNGVAVDKNGTVFVTDRDNLCVRRISNGIVSTINVNGPANLINPGGFEGAANEALWYAPMSIAVDYLGRLYVGFGTSISIVNPDGTYSLLAGNGLRGYADGMGSSARFNSIRSMTVDSAARYLYVSDYYNKVIRRIDIGTTQVTSLTGTGFIVSSGGSNTTMFGTPTGVFLTNDTLFTIDTSGNQVMLYDVNGTFLDAFGNGLFGSSDGINGSFGNPVSVVVNSTGAVFVGDIGNLMLRMVIY